MPLPETYDDAIELISVPDDYEANRSFLDGDHWQSRAGWSGTKPDETNAEEAEAQWTRIQNAFSSQNTLGECAEHHVDAVIGRDPDFTIVDPDAEDSEAPRTDEQDETILLLESYLRQWWDDENGIEVTRDAALDALSAGKGFVRLWWETPLPEAQESADGAETVEADAEDVQAYSPEDLSDALRFLRLEWVPASNAFVGRLPDTRQKIGVVSLSRGEDSDEVKYCEVYYETTEGMVIVRTLIEGEDSFEDSPPYDLGGLLPLIDLKSRKMISEQIRSQQKDLNYALTVENMNIGYAAFRQRNFLNAKPPGEYVKDDQSATGQRFVPSDEPMDQGPGVVNFLWGNSYRDKDGNLRFDSVTVESIEPINPEYIQKSQNRAMNNMMAAWRQRHRLMAGDAVASGTSRVQARDEFRLSITPTQKGCTATLRDTALCALRWGATVSGETAILEALRRYRIDAAPRIFLGYPTSEEQKVLNAMYDMGNLSLETYLVLSGIDDAEAEMQRLEREKATNISALRERMELAQFIYTEIGGQLEQALLLAGVPEDVIDEFMTLGDPGAAIAGDGAPGTPPAPQPQPEA